MHSHLAKMLGQYILEERTVQKVQQRKLAKDVKVSAQFLGRIEKGDVMVPDEVLSRCIISLKLDKSKLVTIFRAGGEQKAKLILDNVKQINKKRRTG